MKILYNSTEIREAVKELFGKTSTEKLAIVGFVGADAHYYLPDIKGIRVICWDKNGATNPDGLRALIAQGAKVQFETNLHMKLFYAKGRGAIITSANLSKNAFGEGGLKELGISIPANAINIKKILASFNPRDCTAKRLFELDEHLNDNPFKGNSQKRTARVTFKDWYKTPDRKKWKLGWCMTDEGFSKAAKEYSLKHFEVKEPYQYNCCKPNDFKKNDWVLTFMLKRKKPARKYANARAIDFSWMKVDFVIHTKNSAKYPFEAVEVMEHHNPPFDIDTRFRKALNSAMKTDPAWNAQSLIDKNTIRLTEGLVESLWKHYLKV